jgi:adenosylcobinamide amidohydrolase
VIHNIESRIERNSLVVTIPPEFFPFPRAISWAIHGGGFSAPRHVVNHTIGKTVWIEDPRAYASWVARELSLPENETIVMMTSVLQCFAGCAEYNYGDLSVRAFSTVGLGNALAAGDVGDNHAETGTINTILAVSAALSDEALIECLAVATEAKSFFLFERGVKSVLSGKLATGTGTDCITVVSLGTGEKLSYAGKHTKLGELIARATTAAMSESLRKRLSANDSSVKK